MKPYLALFRAGPSSLHAAAVERLADQNFDYALSWFGSEPPIHAAGAAFVHAVRGPKWDGLAQTMREHWETIRQYEFVWLPDDDLLCVPEDISRMFTICDELRLELAQPALTPDSYATHLITFQHSAFQLRFTNFVEIMAPVLSAGMLERALPTMAGQVSGYGLDTLWPRMTTTGRMAVIDDTPVVHTRPVGGPNHELARKLGGLTPGQEAVLVCATHGIDTPLDFQVNYGGLLQSGDAICLGQTMAEANAMFGALMQSLGDIQASPVAQAQYLAHHHRYWSRPELYPRSMLPLVLNRALKHAGIEFPKSPKEEPLERHPATQLGAALPMAAKPAARPAATLPFAAPAVAPAAAPAVTPAVAPFVAPVVAASPTSVRPAAPSLSVIVPTFQRSAILRRCLAHLEAQTLPADRFEVIVVDDGSTDDTAQVLDEAARRQGIVHLRQSNLGPAAARNRALAQARGGHVLFLNDDALLDPRALAIHLEEHARLGPRDAVLGAFRMHPEFMRMDRPVGQCLDRSDLIFDYALMSPGQVYGHRHFYTCNLSISRDFVLRHGGFAEGFVRMGAEDIELGMRLEHDGCRVHYRPDCVAHHAHRLDVPGLARMFQFRGRGGVHLFTLHPHLPAHYREMTLARRDELLMLHAGLQPMLGRLEDAITRFDAREYVAEGVQMALDKHSTGIDFELLWRWPGAEIERMLGRLVQGLEHLLLLPAASAPSLEEAAARVYPALQFVKWYHDTIGVVSSEELPDYLHAARLAWSSAQFEPA